MPEVTYTADMLPAAIAAVEARLALCDAVKLADALSGPHEVGDMLIGRMHYETGDFCIVWTGTYWQGLAAEDHVYAVYEPARIAVTWHTLRTAQAHRPVIHHNANPAARTGYPALLRMELARLREHEAAEAAHGESDRRCRKQGFGPACTPDTLTQLRRDTARCWAQMQGRE